MSKLVAELVLGASAFKAWEFKSLFPYLKKNILKQKSLAKAIIKTEKLKSVLKLIVNTEILPLSVRENCANRLHSTSVKKTVRRVCTITGRGRGVICQEKISRLEFKRLIEKGLVSGLRKV